MNGPNKKHTLFGDATANINLAAARVIPYLHPLPVDLVEIIDAHSAAAAGTSPVLVLTNNLILLFSMFASGLGMYLLAYALTRNHLAAILAGIFFSFAPFRFNRLPHIQMQLYAFIPLFLGGLHRYIATHRPRWLVVAAVAFVFQALSGTYLGAIAAVALGIALVSFLPYAGFSWRELSHVAIALVVMALVLVPFALPYMWVHRELGVEWDLSGLGGLSATPKAYLASSSHLYRTLSEAVTTEAERTDYLFPGLTLLVLGACGLVMLLKDSARRRIGICYAGILVAGIVLSFGPSTAEIPDTPTAAAASSRSDSRAAAESGTSPAVAGASSSALTAETPVTPPRRDSNTGKDRQAISQIAVMRTSAATAALNMSLLVPKARPKAAKLTPPPV